MPAVLALVTAVAAGGVRFAAFDALRSERRLNHDRAFQTLFLKLAAEREGL